MSATKEKRAINAKFFAEKNNISESEAYREILRRKYKKDALRKKAVKRKKQLVKRDGEGCFYCKTLKGITVDHVIPLCDGGTSDLINLRLACLKCNHDKGRKAHDEFNNTINDYEASEKGEGE